MTDVSSTFRDGNGRPAPVSGSYPATDDAAVVVEAARVADDLAAAAGVRVQALLVADEQHAAAAVLQRVWGHSDSVPLPPELLRAFAFTGNYVGAAFEGDRMVGVACAFRTAHGSLHSHIAGVLPSYQGHSIGYLLKLHQRAWALANGIASISWTFDPLVRRNAYFNLVKIGALATGYLADFYGPITDRINDNDRSDRLLVEWDLSAPVAGYHTSTGTGATSVLQPGAGGEPVLRPGSDGPRLIAVPPDIEAVRRTDPALAIQWRSALRAAMTDVFDSGQVIVGLNQDKAYVSRRKDPT